MSQIIAEFAGRVFDKLKIIFGWRKQKMFDEQFFSPD